MKKNYSLLGTLLLGGAFVASAAAPAFTGQSETVRMADRCRVKAEAVAVEGVKAQVKQQAADTDKWEALGTGSFTDFVLTTLEYAAQTMEVTFEKSTTTPGRYRIVNPYEKWVDPKGQFPLAFDATKMTPIVFDVVNDKYVYVHEFNTGYSLETADGGEISCEMNAGNIIASGVTLEEIAAQVPGCLGTYKNGNITASDFFSLQGQQYAVFIVSFSKDTENLYLGNSGATFAIKMPGAKEIDPNDGWKEAGKAKYTDFVIPSMFDLQAQTFEVPMQESEETPGLYRLVNPYKYWTSPDANSFTVEDNHYLVIHAENAPDVWIENTETGVNFNGQNGGMISFFSQLGDIMPTASYETVKAQLPAELWATIKDDVITYPNLSFAYNGQTFTNYGATISSNPDGFYPARANNFRVELPKSGVEGIVAEGEGEAEYFTLDGMRVETPAKGTVVVRRQGGKASKMIIR